MLLEDDGLELLSDDECLALLAGAEIGRIGITVGALPVILPVNFTLVDGDIVFATGEGTKLRAAVRNAIVAFECDGIDPRSQGGWSVLAVGTASELTNVDACARARGRGVRSWAGGDRHHLVRMHPEFLSGRRLRAAARMHRD